MSRLRFIPQQLEGEIMKHWKTLLAASIVAIVGNASFAENINTPLPAGWIAGGSLGKHFTTSFSQQEKLFFLDLAFGKVTSSKDKDTAFSITAKSSATESDTGVLTQVIDVTASRDETYNLAFFFKQEGEIADKDVWIRFFDERGPITLTQLDLPISFMERNAQDNWLNVSQQFRIPSNASRMEVGIGMRGQGTFQLRNLTLMSVPAVYGGKARQSFAFAASPLLRGSLVKPEDIKLEP
jgi:hypothetical protein|nr:hypothetical protein [uncultured Undibacterium sp.]